MAAMLALYTSSFPLSTQVPMPQ